MAQGTRRSPAGRRRSTTTSWWVAVASVVFTLTGAIMFAAGEGADRLWGLVLLLVFGVGGIALHVPKGDRGPGIVLGRTGPDGRWRLTFAFDRRRWWTSVGGGSAFAAAGVLLVRFADELAADATGPGSRPVVLRVVGSLAALVFGGVAVGALLTRRRPARMVVSGDGVLFDAIGTKTFVPWDAVARVDQVSVFGNATLGITVDDRARIETSGVLGRLIGINRGLTGADVAQQLDSFVASPELVLGVVRRFAERPGERLRLAAGTLSVQELLADHDPASGTGESDDG